METKNIELIDTLVKKRMEPTQVEIPNVIRQLEKILVQGEDPVQLRQDVLICYNSLKEIERTLGNGNAVDELQKEVEAGVESMKKEAVVQAIQNLVVQLAGDSGIAFDGDFSLPDLTSVSTPTAQKESSDVAAEEGELPWIESELCTTCDECTKINKKIFSYNNDKKAVVKDPRGGPFRDIVKAAEKCPSQIIHPGDPLNPKEKDLTKWVTRAQKYQ